MNHVLLGLLAETFVHPGAGQTGGAIDLPVAREAATDYPFVAGSSLKGALRDATGRDLQSDERDRVFGEQDRAGALLVSDARLLLLPVRSLTGAYRWATCPHLLERLARDARRAGIGNPPDAVLRIEEYRYVDASNASDGDKLYLEERSFEAMQSADWAPAAADGWIEMIGGLISDAAARKRLAERLVLLNDHDFSWFARNCLAVHARNVLDEQKRSVNLWYEEALPPDTLMYTVLAERDSGSGGITAIHPTFERRPYLQVGGNETVGQGWFAVAWRGTGG